MKNSTVVKILGLDVARMVLQLLKVLILPAALSHIVRIHCKIVLLSCDQPFIVAYFRE